MNPADYIAVSLLVGVVIGALVMRWHYKWVNKEVDDAVANLHKVVNEIRRDAEKKEAALDQEQTPEAGR